MQDTSQQLPWTGNWQANNVEKINKYLFKLSGLSITNNAEEPTIKIPGKHILGFYNYFYWHIVHEDVAHFEGLKLEIPDLNLTLIDIFDAIDEYGNLTKDAINRGPYLKYFLTKYPQKHIIKTNTNVWFEEVYYIPTMGEVFPIYSGKPFSNFNITPMSMPGPEYDAWCKSVWTERSDYGINGLKILSEKMKLDKSNKIFSENIFISRRDVNKRLASFIGVEGYEYLIQERLFEDDFLESYFEKRGYQIVALEEISYEDQISLFMGAKKIAGTAGAGFANLHLCNPGTKLFELRVLPIYQFNYEYYKDYNQIDYCAIELRDGVEDPPWTPDKIIEKLNTVSF